MGLLTDATEQPVSGNTMKTAAATSQGGSIPLSSLFTANPGVAQASPTTANTSMAAATGANAQTAQAQNAQAQNAQAQNAGTHTYNASDISNPTGMSSDSSVELNRITSQDSPIMKQARQTGILSAARRGLTNSSIAAGNSEAEMVKQASPLALQNATVAQNTSLANQAAENAAGQFNAGEANKSEQLNAQLGTDVSKQNAALGTDVSKQNAALGTDVSKQNAALETQTNQQNANNQTSVSLNNSQQANNVALANAQAANQASLQNAQQANQISQTVLQANSDLTKQYLAGTQAEDLATIQGKYQQLISTNEQAGALFKSYYDSIAQAMANKDITPARMAGEIGAMQATLAAGLKLIQDMNGLNVNFNIPAVQGSGDSFSVIGNNTGYGPGGAQSGGGAAAPVDTGAPPADQEPVTTPT